MKHLKYLLFTFLVLIPINVFAGYTISCPSASVKSGDLINCSLYGDPADEITFKLTFDDNVFSFYGAYMSSHYENKGSGKYIDLVSNGTNSYDQIANFQFLVKNVSNGTYDMSGTNFIVNNNSTQTNLGTITANPVVISNPTTTVKAATTTTKATYTASFDPNGGNGNTQTLACSPTGSSCNVTLTNLINPTKNGATFTGWSTSKTCTNVSTKTYSLTKDTTLYACYTVPSTTQTTPTSSVLYLKSLGIENQSLTFSKFKYSYELKVLYSVTSLNILAEAEDSGTTVNLSNPYTLKVGENTINVVVSKGTQSTTYNLKVTRLKEGEVINNLSNDATLTSITIEDYSIAFNPTTTNYNLTVDYNTPLLNITAIANNSNAKYTVSGNTDISDGSVIKISVLAEDGKTTKVYNINVHVKSIFEQYKVFIIAGGVILLIIIIYIIGKNKQNKNKAKPAIKTVTKTTTTTKTVVKPKTTTVSKPANKEKIETL